MSKIDTGGPAFPCDLAAYDPEVQQEMSGMALRDYFAAKDMQSDLVGGVNSDEFDLVARRAYMMADAMLSARGTEKARKE